MFTMVDLLENPISLTQCSLESDGTVICKIGKTKFENIQGRGIKPKRIVFEIEG